MKRIVVRGRQRQSIDPELLVQVLLAMSREAAQPDTQSSGTCVDTHQSTVEDRGERP